MASTEPVNPAAGFVRALTKIERHEVAAVVWSFLLVFVLMTSYMILKPLRDALAADWGNVGLSITWTVNFGMSLIAVAVYGAALTYFRFRIMVPAFYVFFALTFIALYFMRSSLGDPTLVNKGFYVWVSVFSLFNLSVFWSFMTDVFNSEQARRLFGVIAAGTTVGAITGPILTAALVDDLGANGLLLLSAVLLFFPLLAIPLLRREKDTRLGNADLEADLSKQQALGTNPFSGFSVLASDRYLLGICVFILLYVTINTFVYFELQNLTREYSLEFRARVWSWIEITTNVLTLVTAALVTSRIVIRLGMKTALALMPAACAIMSAVQCVVSPGGSSNVRATTRSATAGPSGGMREGRVLSRNSPSKPSAAKRSCQRQTQVFDLPVCRIISTVPAPSALNRMISARQTCFCGALRFLMSAISRWRSIGETVNDIPVRMPQTRTRTRQRESPIGLLC